ncbi:MAG TPA: nuclear transport factor 2 family protein [Thermotogota bacterium]|nr:nuclear transport factor 2 family protein [Thermotogota bacterium]HPR97301.1 nuclear transport factor 2 family protein [Thermotogota bacterium]
MMTFLMGAVMAEKDGTEMTNREKVLAVLKSIETGDSEAISFINPEYYIQHNLGAGDGLSGFGELLSCLPEGSARVNTIRAFEDGAYVFTHTDYNFFGPKIGFDIFRFEDGLIVEHWDNLTVTSEDLNPSGRTEIDGTTEFQDLDETESNRAFVTDFVNTILVNGEYDRLQNFFDGDRYIQHNTGIADGLSGLSKGLEALAKAGVTMVYDKVHRVLAEGNFVLAVSEGKFGGNKVSFYDLFRVENGKIAEHWDVIEKIPAREEWKNDNGKF